jgi:hypothetical protein
MDLVACIDPVCGVAMKTIPFTELRNARVSALNSRRPSAARRTCFTTRPPRLWHTKTSGTPLNSRQPRRHSNTFLARSWIGIAVPSQFVAGAS